ncbi:MAG: hypothetical protein HC786_20435 [Richelia sp. CSU_2_1]|nr:hypothetical protein [Richelia sp. CSU_2_1]
MISKEFYNKEHIKLRQRKIRQANACCIAVLAGFTVFLAVPTQFKKIDALKTVAISVSLLASLTGLGIILSKKELDNKDALSKRVKNDILGQKVASDVAIAQEEQQVYLERCLEKIAAESGGER